jgi:hypothetical protein
MPAVNRPVSLSMVPPLPMTDHSGEDGTVFSL